MDNEADSEHSTGEISIWARVQLGHAVIQNLAESHYLRVLHLKGPAALPHLRSPGRTSSDVDVLVHPDDAAALQQAMATHGWVQRTSVHKGSAFAHAANWWHDQFGYVDVHHSWPGPKVAPDLVFNRLARGDYRQPIANVDCPVPGEVEQLLVLVLHAARSVGKSDIQFGWQQAVPHIQQQVRALALELDAEVPFLIGIGEAADPDAPEHDLWAYYSRGGTDRVEELKARLKAAPGPIAKAKVVSNLLAVNQEHLELKLGHPPSRREIRAEQRKRVRKLWNRNQGPDQSAEGGV